MSPEILRKTVLYSLAAICLACAGVTHSVAQETPSPAFNANQLVRQVVQSELKAEETDHTHWMYKLHREDEKGAQDRQVIETKDGSLAKVLLINGQPLTPEQRSKDEERMKRQVQDPAERARREKRNKEDEEKARELLKAIPDAFIFTYEGMDAELTRLAFTPNSHYDPPTRELTVYHSMAGRLWVDRTAMRLAKIEGHLLSDVNFGWGLLGHLDKGGTFTVVQRHVGENHWETVLLDLNMQGRAVIFKTITVKQKQVLTDFIRVPDNLSIAEGFEMLNRMQSTQQSAISVAAEKGK